MFLLDVRGPQQSTSGQCSHIVCVVLPSPKAVGTAVLMSPQSFICSVFAWCPPWQCFAWAQKQHIYCRLTSFGDLQFLGAAEVCNAGAELRRPHLQMAGRGASVVKEIYLPTIRARGVGSFQQQLQCGLEEQLLIPSTPMCLLISIRPAWDRNWDDR